MKTMFKNKTEILGVMLVIILAIGSMPNLFYGSNHWQAYADLSIQIVTPTGGTLSSSSDCTIVARSQDIIWHNCNNVLYAINNSTLVALTSLALTVTTSDRFLGSPDSNAVYHLSNTGNTVTRYIYDGSAIVANGVFNPSSCNFGANLQYDAQGYMWTICDSEDTIIKFNPATMTEVVRSQDLTDGAGIECDLPTRIAYSPTDNVGAIACSTTTNTVIFKVASSSSITLTDSEATTSGIQVVIDETNNRILGFNGATLSVYTYVPATGVTTLSQTITVSTDNCTPEYSAAVQKFIVCNDDSGTNTIVQVLFSNSTGVFHLASGLASGFDNSEAIGIDVTSGSFANWFFASNLNNQRIVIISGLREGFTGEPTPPSGDVPNIVGGVDCNLEENENKLICRVSDNGAIGNFIIGNGTSGLTGLVCNLGVVSCDEDSNPQTNGAGLLVFIASLFVIVGMFYVAMGRNAFAMPVFIWIIIIIALSAFFTITGIIDPIFLILSIVAIVALAVPRLMGVIRGGNTLGGGSSE